jgi:Major Facilitator Superfamily
LAQRRWVRRQRRPIIARYAATDLAPAAHRATTLSVVVWVATVGAVLGPLMVGPAAKVAANLGLPPLTGPFLFDMTCAAIAGLVIFALMRPDPLLVARQTRYLETPTETRTETPVGTPTAARTAARTSRLGGVAPTAAALVLAHATMTAVMVMTPLEMHHHGATHAAIGAAISVHFLGMFAFSPLSGLLADRVGVRPALVTGAAILIASLLVLAGLIGPPSITHGVGLFLLGLGWSVCTVAASSHIAAHSAGDTRVQGSTDTAMTIVSAGAALAAGPLMAIWGFTGLLVLAAAFCVGVLLSAPRIRPAKRQAT